MGPRTLIFVAGCLVGIFAGYVASSFRQASEAPPRSVTQETSPQIVTLATVLQSRGVMPESITHFRFIGDEHSYTQGRVATDTNVTWIWDRMIRTAEPYSFWEGSGTGVSKFLLALASSRQWCYWSTRQTLRASQAMAADSCATAFTT
jgi:hypothetical protein